MKFESVVPYNGSTVLTKYNSYKYVGTGAAVPEDDKVVVSSANIKVDDAAAVVLYDGHGRSKMLTGKQYNALTSAKLLGVSSNNGSNTLATAVFTKEKNGLTRAMMVAGQDHQHDRFRQSF